MHAAFRFLRSRRAALDDDGGDSARVSQRSADVPMVNEEPLAEEEEPVDEELDELDEDGLYAYQRLGETFERELVEIGALLSVI